MVRMEDKDFKMGCDIKIIAVLRNNKVIYRAKAKRYRMGDLELEPYYTYADGETIAEAFKELEKEIVMMVERDEELDKEIGCNNIWQEGFGDCSKQSFSGVGE